MINVLILFGGKSVEHDISIITYTQVICAIDLKKYNVKSVYLDQDNNFYLLKKDIKFDGDIKDRIDKKNLIKCCFKKKYQKRINKYLVYCNNYLVDVVINCVHGKGLEDGTLSGYFDLLNVSYTNSNLLSSCIFHNKFYTKLILNKYNIKTIDYEYITKYEWINYQQETIKRLNRFGEMIVKPSNLGSSVGVNIADKTNIIQMIDNGFLYDDGIIVEKKLKRFLEYNQAVYKINNELIISKIEEVKNNSSVYDFIDKYENSDITRICPAKISNQLRNKLTKITKKIGQIANSKGVIRIDYLYDLDEEIIYLNEINVIPGALSFYLFEAKNIYFPSLIDDLIKEAIKDNERQNELVTTFKSNVLESRKRNKLK